jgi:hypothetical protein
LSSFTGASSDVGFGALLARVIGRYKAVGHASYHESLPQLTEWYDRLEKLAEIRQQAASAIPHANSEHEKQDKK